MSKRDDEIRDRILGDGDFGAPPEHEAQAALVRRFRNARKKLLVRLTVWVLVGLAVCSAGTFVLGRVTETRMMLAALFVMLVGFESTVLIKLWYWTLDSKAALMEQLQRLGLRLEGGVEPETDAAEDKVSFSERLSMKWYGRVASALVLVAGMSFGVWVLMPLFHATASVVYRSECHAVLDASGSARVTGRMTFAYYGVTPLETVRVPTGDKLQDAAWTDAAGHALSSTQEQSGAGWVSLVQLPQPLFREESTDLRVTWTIPDAAREQGGAWTFDRVGTWRRGLWPQLPLTLNAYLGGVGESSQSVSTVTLPVGAKTTRVTGSWMTWSDYTGHQTVMWRDLQRTEAPAEVSYTLPENRGIAAR
jgi:hypothetical protein